MRGRVLQPGRRQAVQVPGRPPRRRVGLPPRLQQLAIGQSHQDRVQRAGSQPDLESQLVAVAPRRRIGRERPENLGGLARRAAVSGHAPKSTYVEIVRNSASTCTADGSSALPMHAHDVVGHDDQDPEFRPRVWRGPADADRGDAGRRADLAEAGVAVIVEPRDRPLLNRGAFADAYAIGGCWNGGVWRDRTRLRPPPHPEYRCPGDLFQARGVLHTRSPQATEGATRWARKSMRR